MTSEFGCGYATCLIQFANHRARLEETLDTYARMRGAAITKDVRSRPLARQKVAGHRVMAGRKYPDLFTEASAAEIWASGASDHLVDLESPPAGLDSGEWGTARKLADRALDIGHGFRETSTSDAAECRLLLSGAEDLLLNIGVDSLAVALAWDTAHGLNPEEGDWSCSENLSRAERVAAR